MATTFSASLHPTRTRILLITIAVALLLGYGLFSAQRARSATLAKKVFTGVKGSTATLVNPSHVIGISHPATGVFNLTFDRHVDNCSIVAGITEDGGQVLVDNETVRVIRQSRPNNVVGVLVQAGAGGVDGPFDIIGLCPAT